MTKNNIGFYPSASTVYSPFLKERLNQVSIKSLIFLEAEVSLS